MRQIQKVKQSSKTCLGICYAYSFFWAKGDLKILDEGSERVQELPLTAALQQAQFMQIVPSRKTEWLPDFLLECQSDTIVKRIEKCLIHHNDTVLLKYYGFLFGHVLAIKKIDANSYQYFDCNKGVFEFNHEEMSEIFSKIQAYNDFYSFFMIEKLSEKQDLSPKLFKNVFICHYLTCLYLLLGPLLGLFKLGLYLSKTLSHHFLQFFQKICHCLGANQPNTETNEELAETKGLVNA